MSAQKHTPGPWTSDDEGGYIFANNGQSMVAQVRGWGELQYKGEAIALEIQRLNGELIAASPDMLALLKELQTLIGVEEVHETEVEEISIHLLDKLAKTIAKAEGTAL